MKFIYILVFLIFSLSSVHAEDKKFGAMMGAGTSVCKELNERVLTESGKKNARLMTLSWMQGYNSYQNKVQILLEEPLYDLRSRSVNFQWEAILDYCLKNPSDPVFLAIESATKFFEIGSPPK